MPGGNRFHRSVVASAVALLPALLSVHGVGASAVTGAHEAPTRPSLAAATRCADLHPSTWMGCIAHHDHAFAGTLLSAMALPGSHDAGTFDLDPTYFDKQSGSDCTSYTPLFAHVPAVVKRWSQTQNLDFTGQLDTGVRYLDFRIAFTGTEKGGWRLVHTQFSRDALVGDVAEIAAWAEAHPSEAVVIDVQHLCYDNAPTPADDAALWADFAPLAPVSFDATSALTPANVALGQLTGTRGRAHNVVLVLPDYSVDAPALAAYGVHATFSYPPGSPPGPGGLSPAIPEEYAWPSSVTPTARDQYSSANEALAQYPQSISPVLGSLQGSGIYQSQLIYSEDGSNINQLIYLVEHFSGLIPDTAPGRGPRQAGSAPALHAWEAGMWSAEFNRNAAIAAWGSKLNVVVSDGVEYGGYVPAVVGANAA
ncbi:MAG TPA: hypothetical protein VGS21_02540 [Acidimicrobiales bacterium]|nr:hypothetical protein [Acidimicrobiales bacterium]